VRTTASDRPARRAVRPRTQHARVGARWRTGVRRSRSPRSRRAITGRGPFATPRLPGTPAVVPRARAYSSSSAAIAPPLVGRAARRTGRAPPRHQLTRALSLTHIQERTRHGSRAHPRTASENPKERHGPRLPPSRRCRRPADLLPRVRGARGGARAAPAARLPSASHQFRRLFDALGARACLCWRPSAR
jgi:hypothetical protein